jgi:hypothetical protein
MPVRESLAADATSPVLSTHCPLVGGRGMRLVVKDPATASCEDGQQQKYGLRCDVMTVFGFHISMLSFPPVTYGEGEAPKAERRQRRLAGLVGRGFLSPTHTVYPDDCAGRPQSPSYESSAPQVHIYPLIRCAPDRIERVLLLLAISSLLSITLAHGRHPTTFLFGELSSLSH